MAGIPAARVVAVIAELGSGKWQIGSGYLFDAGHVLTARHCTHDKVTEQPAKALTVVWADGGAPVTVTVSHASPSLDVALLAVEGSAPWDADLPGGPVTFGKVDRDYSGQLDGCEALGYPSWQGDPTGRHRDLAELNGFIRATEGRETKRLLLRDPALKGVGGERAGIARAGTGRITADDKSEWSGVSGAAVFYGGLLLGVIIEHHPRQGQTSLQIRPIDAIAVATDHDTVQLASALRLTSPGAFLLAEPPGAHDPARAGLRPAAYLSQVEEFAPPELLDRDEELAELARFCLDPDAGPYAWWQAEPWAGKTALMSSFVLRPPTEVAAQVQIVSFFVSRVAAQDTVEVFTEVLLGQLAAMLGQPPPTDKSEAMRGLRLRYLMSEAAARCRDAGRRLALVVDGLDEDRRVPAGQGARSIAGLLPGNPPAGMRVIVAGRPDPPVPGDVPDWHPLRKPEIIRRLSASPHARDIARLSREELQRILVYGSKDERDMVGLLTAARGGLTVQDLAHLTGMPPVNAEAILSGSAGRTFTSRPSPSGRSDRAEIFRLGHEELRVQAESGIGNDLAKYRDLLHAWADTYRDLTWPADTPEYLLSDYYQFLADPANTDIPRMIRCALDMARHDRMLDLTGGDAAGIAEARTALERVAAQESPDLVVALDLARQRDDLAARNWDIPPTLPAVWAALGQLPRALALANSISYPSDKAGALTEVLWVLGGTDQRPDAAAIAAQAEAAARSVTSPFEQQALANIMRALAWTGHHQQATEIARSLTDPELRAVGLAHVAGALAQAMQHVQAADIAAEAITVAQSVPGSRRQMEWVLARVESAFTPTGEHLPSIMDYRGIEALDGNRTGDELSTQVPLAVALAQAGQHQQAEDLARSITHPVLRADALIQVAVVLARAGQHQQAAAIAAQIETDARAAAITYLPPYALAQAARGLAQAGRRRQAAAMAAEAKTAFLSHHGWNDATETLLIQVVTAALAQAGKRREAVALARFIPEGERALTQAVIALAQAGRRRQAAAVARRVTAIARHVIGPEGQVNLARSYAAVAQAWTHPRAAALAAQAEGLAASIVGDETRENALPLVAGALAHAGQHEQAESLAYTITNPDCKADALAQIAGALAHAGQQEQAEMLARSITVTHQQADALTQIAGAYARAGDPRSARRVAAEACMAGNWMDAVLPVLHLMPSSLTAVNRILRGA